MANTTVNSLLDSASSRQCKQLAKNVDLHGKRAKALLALNDGDSHSVAAEKSGMTTGQVSYLVGRFKKIGMELFIATRTKKAVAKKAAIKKVAAKKTTPAVAKPAIDNTETVDTDNLNKDKKKKTKKSSKKDKAKKDSKKDKKTKKNKKNKKGKKSKKNKK